MPLDDTTANAIYSSNLENLRRGGGVVGGGLGALGGGLLGHAVGSSFAHGNPSLGRGLVAGAGLVGGGIAGALAGKRLGETLAEPMTNSQLKKLEENLAQQPPQQELYDVMPEQEYLPPEYFEGYKDARAKFSENFPVPAIDVSTYSPTQGSVYPMAGITSLRPNPQVKSTFFDTDATGTRRNLNIGQEQSPSQTPEMPQLPKKEGAWNRGYSSVFTKLAVSSELAQKVLAGRAVGGIMDGLVSPGGGKLDAVLESLKKFPRTIRRAGPDARRLIYGSRPQQFAQPLTVGAKDAWKYPKGIWNFLMPKAAEASKDLVLDKVNPSTRCITGTSGVVGFPGKQGTPPVAAPEKPEVRGDTGAAIWR